VRHHHALLAALRHGPPERAWTAAFDRQCTLSSPRPSPDVKPDADDAESRDAYGDDNYPSRKSMGGLDELPSRQRDEACRKDGWPDSSFDGWGRRRPSPIE
jgi:hypothetical protein